MKSAAGWPQVLSARSNRWAGGVILPKVKWDLKELLATMRKEEKEKVSLQSGMGCWRRRRRRGLT